MVANTRLKIAAIETSVNKLRWSEKEWIRGIEPMVQSQQRLEGQRSRPRFTKIRWVRVSAFGNNAAWLPGLSNLVNTGNEEPWSSKRAVRRSSRELVRQRSGRKEGVRR